VRKTGNREQGIGNRLVAALSFVLLAALVLAWPFLIQAQTTDPASAKNAANARAALDAMVQALGGQAWLTMKNQMLQGKVAAFFHGQPSGGTTQNTWEYPRVARPGPHRVQQASRCGAVLPRAHRAGKSPIKGNDGRCPRSRWTTICAAATTPSKPSSKVWLNDPNTILVYEGQRLAERLSPIR
jgi:hypothetical protein